MKAKETLRISCTGYLTTVGLYMGDTTSGKLRYLNSIPCREVMNCETGKWYDCNDSWVKSISGHDTESSSAYVLFYVMKGGVRITP